MDERAASAAIGEGRDDAGKLYRLLTVVGCEVIGERGDFGWSHCAGVAFFVEADEGTDPMDVGFFGAIGVVEAAQGCADGFDEGHGESFRGAYATHGAYATMVCRGGTGWSCVRDEKKWMKVGDRGLGGEGRRAIRRDCAVRRRRAKRGFLGLWRRRAKSILDRGGLTALLGDYLPRRVKYTVGRTARRGPP